MLSGKESISYYSKSNVAIWMTMAFQAGLLNMGGYMACHRFVSHVTGFATFFGYEVSHTDSVRKAAGLLAVPLFFLFGSMLSGWLVDMRIQLHKKPRYYISFGVIFGLILMVLIAGVLGRFGIFGEGMDSNRDYILLALLCLVCGTQNGMVTSVSRSVIRTTHLTGITTDLGIGLVRLFYKDKLEDHGFNETRANLMRAGIILFFFLGSILGGFTFASLGFWGFALPAATSGILLAITLGNLSKSS